MESPGLPCWAWPASLGACAIMPPTLRKLSILDALDNQQSSTRSRLVRVDERHGGLREVDPARWRPRLPVRRYAGAHGRQGLPALIPLARRPGRCGSPASAGWRAFSAPGRPSADIFRAAIPRTRGDPGVRCLPVRQAGPVYCRPLSLWDLVAAPGRLHVPRFVHPAFRDAPSNRKPL